ncbi:MAG: NifU family protein [Bacteroidetes bacterium]|nr:NifU family protein [Bacteroidota bacterium]
MKTLTEKIAAALAEIRPVLQSDGGDVELVNVTPENIVEVRLLGNCKICPLAIMTLRAGIQATIRRFAPEVRRVESVA